MNLLNQKTMTLKSLLNSYRESYNKEPSEFDRGVIYALELSIDTIEAKPVRLKTGEITIGQKIDDRIYI